MGRVTPTETVSPTGLVLVSGVMGMMVPGGKVCPIERVTPAGEPPSPSGDSPPPSPREPREPPSGNRPPPSPRELGEPPSGRRPPPSPREPSEPPSGRLGKMLLPDPKELMELLSGKVEKGLLSGKLAKGLPRGKEEKARLDENVGKLGTGREVDVGSGGEKEGTGGG
jgi:hypothetical protein